MDRGSRPLVSKADFKEIPGMKEAISESITLTNDNGSWIGQVVITSDGMFSGVTDYGNFSYAWRSFGDDFKKFLLRLDTAYFASKMSEGFAFTAISKKIDAGAKRFAEVILPALQKHIKNGQD